MSQSLCRLGAAAMTLALLGSGLAFAAEGPSDEKDLNAFVCKDVMRLSGSERENALALVHGYRLGKMDTTKYEIEDLAGLTDRFIDFCLDNPDAKALEAFERLGQ
jgi:hypothetical protein